MAREQVKRAPKKPSAAAVDLSGGVLMRDGALVENDPWVFLADGEDGPETGDIVLPMARFLEERDALLARNSGRLGVLIGSAERVEDIAEDIARFDLIAVAFPGYRDGRGFTTARLLRERYGYTGELRAVGDVLPDLLFFMLRCGFNSFTLKAAHPVEDYATAAKAFSVSYQASSDGRLPVHRLRAKTREAGT